MKIKVTFLLKHGQRVKAVLNTPLEKIVTVPISGHEYKFKYLFAVVRGGDSKEIIGAYYGQVDVDK